MAGKPKYYPLTKIESVLFSGLRTGYISKMDLDYSTVMVSPNSHRARLVLQATVEEYISLGQPVASKRLSERKDLQLSSASIRTVMAELEEQGYLKSPHTSAGRVPTDQAYRYFVDQLSMTDSASEFEVSGLTSRFDRDQSVNQWVHHASGFLADITNLASLATKPKATRAVLRLIDFLPLADQRVLAIIVFIDQEFEHRVLPMSTTLSSSRLKESSNFINTHYSATLWGGGKRIRRSMWGDRRQIDALERTTLEMAELYFRDQEEDVLVSGQDRLLNAIESEPLEELQTLYRALSLKEELVWLLDHCLDANGVKLFIGSEGGAASLEECSVIASPYHMNGEWVGALAVIGPTRIPYNRVIPLVRSTAHLLSNALSQR